MKLHFDSHQQYQWDALKAITDIFEGQPLSSGDFEFSTSNDSALFSENGFGNKLYEMALFEDNELEIYIDQFTFSVNDADKTIYENYIPLDSGVENQFARDCESSENIEFYFKLPNWFKIPTPIGNYNPDWAVVFKGEKKIYFVAETKSEGQELLKSEKLKIKCGKEHFKKFDGVIYKQISTVKDLCE